MKIDNAEVYENDEPNGRGNGHWAAYCQQGSEDGEDFIRFWNGERTRTILVAEVLVDDDERFRWKDERGGVHEFRPLTLAHANRISRGRKWTSLALLKKALRSEL